jgi:subtilisin family serine protease
MNGKILLMNTRRGVRSAFILVSLAVAYALVAPAPVHAQATGSTGGAALAAAWPPEQTARLQALDRPGTQILVTLSDPNAARMDLSGRPGPRYLNRSAYRVSTGIRQTARRIASRFDLEPVAEWPIRPLALYCIVFHVPEEHDLATLLEQLADLDEIQSAEPLHVFETQSALAEQYNDPYAPLQHALDTMQIPQAHAVSTGRGAAIAVIDTGADFRHPDLAGRIAKHRDFVDSDARGFVDDAHGTAIAGAIAANANNHTGMVGIAPQARLHVLKACWHVEPEQPARCNSFTLAQALSHAIEAGVDIINLSIAGPADTLLSRLVEQAISDGIVVIAAAPADNRAAGFPAGVPGVIVAAASPREPQPRPVRLAPDHAVLAPADEILVTIPNGQYGYRSGSSLAAAHVTGVSALLVARQPSLAPAAIRELLTTSGNSPIGPVNACRALSLLLDGRVCDAGVRTLPTDYRPTANPRRNRRTRHCRRVRCRTSADPA